MRSQKSLENSLVIAKSVLAYINGRFYKLGVGRIWRPVLVAMLAGATGCDKPVSSESVQEHPGKAIYVKYCLACHQGGVAGSPTFGDKEAWLPLMEKGREALIRSVIDGIPPAMPIKGLCSSCTEQQLADAVDYMLVPIMESSAENSTGEPTDQ